MNYREEVIGGARLIMGDCREIAPTLPTSDACVCDPPYGIAFSHGGNDRSGIGRGRYSTKFAGVVIAGDDKPFDPEVLLGLAPICVLWGANHYADRLPPSSAWLVWDKRAASRHCNDFADCELAWTNRGGVARVFRHQWDGMIRASERGVARVHPTQKPVELMTWCIAPLQVSSVIDPYAGPFSTGVACVNLGIDFVGIELEQAYFDAGCRRIEEACRQPRLFAEPPTPIPEERDLFE